MLAIEAIEALNRERLSPLTVLTGEDLGQFSQLKEALLRVIGFEAQDLTVSYFDLRETAFETVAIDLESLPFFAEDKLVILDQVLDVTTAKKRALSDDDLKRLEAYLEAPVETTKLILLAPGKLDSKRRIVKLLKRDGQIFEANEPKEADLRQYFKKQVQALSLEMDTASFEELLVKSHFDFSQISQNLALLKAYKGSGSISQSDIDLALPKSLQDNIFDLTQLVLADKIEAARELVKDLRLQGEDEVKLIAIMLNQLRLFLQLRLLQDQGKSENQLASALSDILGRTVNPYQVKYALRDSRHVPTQRLQKAIQCLIETDYQIKSGLNDKAYLFEVALLKIVA
ncbi:DNA polymerase III subunit delta [Streptococcus ovuberis]|uniref:DNA polymerase III subunit delta n=1 Tax=Streptococcus ovuberis TaxID=1936207 RepID=A0A7X6MZJ7_9STRE|nr:DNA polymerase III subunit delta [Streptococcus ovuberis]NKZ20678.1 DNA polymerase III subunit delta [Streptococcus ovuberis]